MQAVGASDIGPGSSLVVGGCRSGKSVAAEWLARASRLASGGSAAPPIVYLATGVACDDEMERRVQTHRDRRGPEFTTIEEAHALADTCARVAPGAVVLIDCISTWLGTSIHRGDDDRQILAALRKLADTASKSEGSVIIVSGEVGLGIVPDNAMARRFRDLQGEANQILAQSAQRVFSCSLGFAVRLRPSPVVAHCPGFDGSGLDSQAGSPIESR